MYPPLEKSTSSHGASLGRYAVMDIGCNEKLLLYKLKWCDGDYDEGGAYWGYIKGTWIWRAISKYTENEIFVRAKTREEAKLLVLENAPNARFYG
jgi:hypothetical protein